MLKSCNLYYVLYTLVAYLEDVEECCIFHYHPRNFVKSYLSSGGVMIKSWHCSTHTHYIAILNIWTSTVFQDHPKYSIDTCWVVLN